MGCGEGGNSRRLRGSAAAGSDLHDPVLTITIIQAPGRKSIRRMFGLTEWRVLADYRQLGARNACRAAQADPPTHRPAALCKHAGHPGSDPGAESRAARLGRLLPDGQRVDKFNQIDRYVHIRLVQLLLQRAGQRRWKPGARPFRHSDWPHRRLVTEHGLYQLLGTIRYPGGAHAA